MPRLIQIGRINDGVHFSVLDQKHPLSANLIQKSKLSVLAETSYLDLFKYKKLNCSVHFFSYRPQRSSLGKFCLKNLNCWFKLKFGTQTNLNVKDSMVMFIFSTFDEFMNFFVVWLTNKTHLALLPAGTIVRYPHYRESLTHCEQDLNLRRS